MFRFTPISPEFSEVVVTWHGRADGEEGRDYDLERLKWTWDVTTIEDTRIIIDNQKGVNSGRYRPGPHAPMESYSAYSAAFTHWYLERLASRAESRRFDRQAAGAPCSPTLRSRNRETVHERHRRSA